MRSSVLSHDFWHEYCRRIFKNRNIDPKTDYTNKMYGGTNIKGHNIIFVNAEEDPWQWAGMRDYNPPHYPSIQSLMVNCTNCGHCIDFHTPVEN